MSAIDFDSGKGLPPAAAAAVGAAAAARNYIVKPRLGLSFSVRACVSE